MASDAGQSLENQLEAVKAGGAARVELCSNMHLDGLTPSLGAIRLAADALGNQVELLVMNRPHGQGFHYDDVQLEQMHQFIGLASEVGAKGTVLGVLNHQHRTFDIAAMKSLVDAANKAQMNVSCHRAFDALENPVSGLEDLKKMGVKRVLTAGAAWGKSGRAYQNIKQLKRYLDVAEGEIEIVVAGGIEVTNLPTICEELGAGGCDTQFSLHSYSAAKVAGKVDKNKVNSLVLAIKEASVFHTRHNH